MDVPARVAELLAEHEAVTSQAMTKAIRSAELDREWVLSRLMEVVGRCMQAVPVRAPGSGKVVEGAWTFDAKGANRALELLGRPPGLWREDGQEKPDVAAILERIMARHEACGSSCRPRTAERTLVHGFHGRQSRQRVPVTHPERR
jgi:hypothetical protein